MIVVEKRKIKNLEMFYKILQSYYHLLSVGDNIIIFDYKDPFEPKWLRDITLKNDVRRALELSSR
ncbi:MAG: hypothetical protein QXV73_05580 [Candidatus Micrarchaeia archaeon]